MRVHAGQEAVIPTEGRCGSCAHWAAVEPDWEFDALVMGRCVAIKQREDILEPARRLCDDWDARVAEEGRLLSLEKAIAVDGSGYYAAVRTQADFGCVLWSPMTRPIPTAPLGTSNASEQLKELSPRSAQEPTIPTVQSSNPAARRSRP